MEAASTQSDGHESGIQGIDKFNPRASVLPIPKIIPKFDELSHDSDEDSEYKTSLLIQTGNLYKSHVSGDEAKDLFPVQSFADSRLSPAHGLIHSRPVTAEDFDHKTDSPILDAARIRKIAANNSFSKASFKSQKSSARLALTEDTSLSDGNYVSNSHAPRRRAGVSGRSTNTILSADGTFITDIDNQFNAELAVAKAVLMVDTRTVDEKIKDACGTLKYPPGFIQQVHSPQQNVSSTPKLKASKVTPKVKAPPSDLDKRLSGLPGGLHLNKAETKKYFGAESRVMFFERAQWLQRQRDIASTDPDHVTSHLTFDSDSVGGNINSDHNIKNAETSAPSGTADNEIEQLANEIAFYPVRAKHAMKVSTKVIIRHQSLDDSSDNFTQMKLIPKPAHLPLGVTVLDDISESTVSIMGDAVSVSDDQQNNQVYNSQYDTSVNNIHRAVQSIAFGTAVGGNSPAKPKLFSLLDPITPRQNNSTSTPQHTPVKSKQDRGLYSRSMDTTPVRSKAKLQSLLNTAATDNNSMALSAPKGILKSSNNNVISNNNNVNISDSSGKQKQALAPLTRNNTSSTSGYNTNPNSRKNSVNTTASKSSGGSGSRANNNQTSNKASNNTSSKNNTSAKNKQKTQLSVNTTPSDTETSPLHSSGMTEIRPLTAENLMKITNSHSISSNPHHSIYSNQKKPEVEPLQFICIDYRDKFNRKIIPHSHHHHNINSSNNNGDNNSNNNNNNNSSTNNLQHSNSMPVHSKHNSLFAYIESKKAHYDFHKDNLDSNSESDNSDVEQLINLQHMSKTKKQQMKEQKSNKNSNQSGNNDSNIDAKNTQNDNNNSNNNDNTENVDNSDDESQQSELLSPNQLAQRRAVVKSGQVKSGNDSTEGNPTDLSPRSHYIDCCIRKRLNPRASLILRKNFTKQLCLQHHGIGDEMMCLFAEAIINIPYIQSLNIADNNLTDKGLGPIVKAIVNMRELIDLNLSYNTIGPTAATCLSEYLSEATCPLERLVLRRADVDDGECERFVTSLKTNRKLFELDLSENLLGSSENLNTVMPDTVTGGEALAELLRSEGCVLTTLKLGWNMIRLEGAADLCNSLKVNNTLTYLDLSFNSLGSVGGMALGDALQDNKTLRTLFVSNNSIDSVACLTICSGILENEKLEFVAFDGNPIGEEGAKALMLLPTMVGSRVKLSAASCNIGIRDPKCWFDSAALLRKFELHLDNPFDRAVAFIILYLVAAHQTYVIAHSEWYNDEDKTTTVLGLSEHVIIDFENKRLDKTQLAIIESLQIVRAAASNITKALDLFHEIDEDGSGQLDAKEFGNLMGCMGMEMGESKVQEIMAEYDVDNGGFIELPEFLLFLKNQLKESNVRLKELTQFPIMSRPNEDENSTAPRVRYVPPRNGILRLAVLDGFTQKSTYRVINGSDREYIMDIARQSGELLKMTGFGVQSYRIRLNEALAIVESLLKENSSKTQILAKVLPQMATPADARMLVSKVLLGNKTDIQRLKREIGPAYKPMLGSSDGYYVLDLGNKMDKFCLNRLLEISMTVSFIRGKRSKLGFGATGDCSQRGDWSCFRNEIFNGKPVVVSTTFATPMPRSGRLEFDFVSERRVEKDSFVLNDVRFTNLLVRYYQMSATERQDALNRLAKSKQASDLTLNGDAKTVYECPKDRATEIGHHMATFYGNLPLRYEQNDRYRQKEGIKIQMEFDPTKLALTFKNYQDYYTIPTIHVPKIYTDPVRTATVQKKRPVGSFMNSKSATPGTPNTQLQSTAGNKFTPAAANNKNQLKPSTADAIAAAVDLFGNASTVEPTTEPSEPTLEGGLTVADTTNPSTNKDRKASRVGINDEVAIAYFSENNSVNNSGNNSGNNSNNNSSNPTPRDEAEGGKGRSKGRARSRTDSSSSVHDVNDGDSTDEETEGISTDHINQVTNILAAQKIQSLQVSSPSNDFLTNAKKVEVMTSVLGKLAEEVPLDEFMNRYICTMASKNVQIQSKCIRQLELLIDLFEFQFLLARHVELLLDLFRSVGETKNSDYFGTYRVELVVSLFACIVDIHNFELVLRALTAFEAACVICRLGWLHIYNPMKPEGAYELDLSRREERVIVKTLAQLATAEPGDNLPDVAFRWEREMDSMPGYELTEPWMTEDGLPRKGLWNVVYYSGEGSCKKGCKPYVKLRRSMLALVFIEESEVVTEHEREEESTAGNTVGETFMLANLGMWYGYLAYNEEEHKALKSKKAAEVAAAAKGAKKRK